MEKATEFQNIGKRLPYKVPEGFFEQVSESTLRKAKQRVDGPGKTLILWQTIAVAACLTGIVLIGYYLMEKVQPEIVVAKVEAIKDTVVSVQKIEKMEEVKNEIAVAKKNQSKETNFIGEVNAEEKLSDILADLSNEELQQMAAYYQADPFMEGIQQ